MYSIRTPIGEIVHKGRGYVEIVGENRAESWQNPLFVQITLTLRCNLMCPWCYAGSSPSQPTEMHLDDVKKILMAVDRRVIGVSFGGGEPLTYPRIREVLRFARNNTELATSITTNGLLLPNMIDTLDYLDEVRISVYPYNYEFLKNKIAELRGAAKGRDVNIGINVMLFRDGIAWVQKVIRDFAEYVDDVLITVFFSEGRGSRLSHMVPTEDDIRSLACIIKAIDDITVKVTGALGDALEKYRINMFKMGREGTVSVYPDLSVSPSSIRRNPRVYMADASEVLMAYRMLLSIGAYKMNREILI